jgi:DUF4097 and DUF4098 domain-containing protein YvlB
MRICGELITALTAALLLGASVRAQGVDDAEWLERCRRENQRGDRERHCEVRELRMPASQLLRVQPSRNGGVRIDAGSGPDVSVHARIQSNAESTADARRIAGEVRIESTGGTLRAEGPSSDTGSWSVTFVLTVSVHGVNGTMDLRALNGPIQLRGVAGNVRARTQNGPINVALSGSSWSGAGLDAETKNGPIHLTVPENYSARLETGTVNGPMSVDFPLTVTMQGRLHKQIVTTLGSGGAPVRVVTTNGPVEISRP